MRSSAYALLRLAPVAASALGNLLLARQLTAVDYGKIAAAYSVAQIVVAVGIFGYDQLLLQRAIPLAAAVRRSVGVVTASSMASIGVAALAVDVVGMATVIPVVLSTAALQVSAALLCAGQAAGEDMFRAGADASVRTALQAGLNVGAQGLGTAAGAASGGLVAVVLGLGVVVARARRWIRTWTAATTESPRSPVVYGLIGLLYTATVGTVGLAVAVKGDAVTNANARIVLLAYGVEVALSASVAGEYFRSRLYRAHDDAPRSTVLGRLWRAVPLAAGLITAGTLGASALVVPLLGDEYRPVPEALVLLAVGAWAHFYQAALASVFITSGRERVSLVRQAIVLVILIPLAVWAPMSATTVAALLVGADVVGLAFYWFARHVVLPSDRA